MMLVFVFYMYCTVPRAILILTSTYCFTCTVPRAILPHLQALFLSAPRQVLRERSGGKVAEHQPAPG